MDGSSTPPPVRPVSERAATSLSEDHDRVLVREVLAMTPEERLDSLRIVDAFFATARARDRG